MSTSVSTTIPVGGGSVVESDYSDTDSFSGTVGSTASNFPFSISDLEQQTGDIVNPKIAINVSTSTGNYWASVIVYAGETVVGNGTLTSSTPLSFNIDIDWDKGTEYKVTAQRTGGSSSGTVNGNIAVTAHLVEHINIGV